MSGLRIAACVVAAASYVFMGLGLARVGYATDWISPWFSPFIALAFLAPVTVGVLIAYRQPTNRIAWILLLGSLALTMQLPVGLLIGEAWSLQMDRALWPLLFAWPIAVAYVFPDGLLLSPRWRWIQAGAGAGCFVVFMTLAMFDTEPFYGEDASVPNPMADNAVGTWLNESGVGARLGPAWLGILASLFLGAYAVRLRLRRSSGVERLQTMAGLGGGADPTRAAHLRLSVFVFGDSLVDWVLFPFLLVMQAAVAAAIGIADAGTVSTQSSGSSTGRSSTRRSRCCCSAPTSASQGAGRRRRRRLPPG